MTKKRERQKCIHETDDQRRDFESKEEAFEFYKENAKSVGFNTIIKASRFSRMTARSPLVWKCFNFRFLNHMLCPV